MPAGIGEICAVATALAWGASNLIQGAIGKSIGSNSVVLLRMPYQVLMLALLCLVVGTDTTLTQKAFYYLLFSALAGIVLCDYCLYKSINIIGPALAVLILSFSTAFSAILGWIFLDESLPAQAVLGMSLAICGIILVATEHGDSTLLPGQSIPKSKELLAGIALAIIAALMLASSFILLKNGMQAGIDPLWASFIRACCGAIALWGIGFIRGWIKNAWYGLKLHPRFALILLVSCSAGATGMWLSSIAVNLAPVGIAATLIGLQPIMVTILGATWFRRIPSLRVIFGSLTAFAGTALICLR